VPLIFTGIARIPMAMTLGDGSKRHLNRPVTEP